MLVIINNKKYLRFHIFVPFGLQTILLFIDHYTLTYKLTHQAPLELSNSSRAN